MKRWSSLQRELYKLIDEKIDLQIHLSIYRMKSQYGSADLPRYWITLDKEIVFDYPKQFADNGERSFYPYITDVPHISELIREYIDTPKDELFTRRFENDHWGLADILRAADKRIGKRRLELLKNTADNMAVQKIIEQRTGF